MIQQSPLIWFSVLISLGFASMGAQSQKAVHVPIPSTWRLDAAQSDLAGAPAPKSDEIVFLEDKPDAFAFSEDMTFADGKTQHVSWKGKPDGTLRPLEGSEGDQAAFSQDLTTARVVGHDGTVAIYSQRLTDDQRSLEQSVDITLSTGGKMHQKIIYRRLR